MNLTQILILTLTTTLTSQTCTSYCGADIPNTYFCFADKTITPSLCHRNCLPGNPSLEFMCKFNNLLERRMCIYRCHSKTAEENTQFFKDGGCNCPRIFEPVCGDKNTVYFNDCLRQCNSEGLMKKGFCRSNEKWVKATGDVEVFKPMCGQSGKMYPNEDLGKFFEKTALKEC